jgi:protoporphyrinogen oxidase
VTAPTRVSENTSQSVVIVGAGPGGLTAAYLLAANKNMHTTVLEADPELVGGISKTVSYRGYRFDIGGHRFFSKSAEVESFWSEILGAEMLDRPRKSRIYYGGKFYGYPLKPFEAVRQLGLLESFHCGLSYLKAKIFPTAHPRHFQDWVTNQFGARLFQIFFKTYTEKVWGLSCQDISADWAAQRIKGLSLSSAVFSALKPRRNSPTIKSLIESFRYPRFGPGQMWEKCAELLRARGGEVKMGCRMTGLERDPHGKGWKVSYVDFATGLTSELFAGDVVLTSPLGDLAKLLPTSLGSELQSYCQALKYRDFLTVALIVKRRNEFDDNWIYIHDPDVSVGRIQNFRSWSPSMVPDETKSCYGLEYFCNEGDPFWTMQDSDLIKLAEKELLQLGLAQPGDVVDGCVVRQAKAYPVYDHTYRQNVDKIRDFALRELPGLHFVGRNGMHKYNNQDHSMMTAMLTAQNILAGATKFDVWQVNEDAEYHESGSSGLRQIPIPLQADTQQS